MKSIEIICCLFVIIFALAVAHPLPDNVLAQLEAKEDPTAPELPLKDPSRPALLLKEPTAPALALKDPSRPALLLKEPTAPALALKEPSRPALLLKEPSAPTLALKEPSAPTLKDATAPADPQTLNADDNASSSSSSSSMSQNDLQEQQDSEAIMLLEPLEHIFNDPPQENEFQEEE